MTPKERQTRSSSKDKKLLTLPDRKLSTVKSNRQYKEIPMNVFMSEIDISFTQEKKARHKTEES